MKLFFLFVLLCGLTSTSGNAGKPKKIASANQNAKSFDLVPSGLIFQF